MATNTAAQPAPRRVRKRILIPSVLLVLVLVAGAWMWRRGTKADSAEVFPGAVESGSVTHLLAKEGRTYVRSAVVVPAPPAKVWKAVTDYDSHPRFMPYIAEISSSKAADGRTRLVGVAHSRLWGDFPFEINVSHREDADKGEYSATWHEEGKSGFTVNRGGWYLTPWGDGHTMLVFMKQAELPSYPSFVIRNILLDRLGSLVSAMRDEALRR